VKTIFSKSFLGHIKATSVLSVPIILSQLGHVSVGLADTIFVGQTNSAVQLAAISLANSLAVVTLVGGIGLSMGLTPLVAKLRGEGDSSQFSALLSNGLLLNVIFGLVIVLLGFAAEPFFNRLGQAPEVLERARVVFRLFNLSILPVMFFQAFRQFMEGNGYTKGPMWVSIAANVLNIALNYILVYGKFGMEPLGAVGSGAATLIARVLMAAGIYLLFVSLPSYKAFRIRFALLERQRLLSIFRLGYPIGLQLVFEVGAFSGAALIIGWMGAYSLAAHQIVISMASVTYMAASGFGSAATIRVGYFLGAQSRSDIRQASFASYFLVIAFMLLMALFFVLFKDHLPLLFTKNPEIIAIASTLIIQAAWFQVADGTQVVGLGALRGLQDVKGPTIISGIAYWLFAIPVGYLLGIVWHMQAIGVWLGLSLGLGLASITLFLRFINRAKAIRFQSGAEAAES